MLGALIKSTRPVIVTGCITDFAEQEMVLDAFVTVRAHHPDALLVLAPRHPEVSERMQILRDYLGQRGLPAVFRSALADTPIAAQTACLVLDTMGELRDFYAAATVAHVGVDHNVLEPLGFGKPVTVKPGWNTTYPSYPVYRLLMDSQTLIEVAAADQLSAHWLDLIDNANHYREHIDAIGQTLTEARGAVVRHLELLAPWMPKHR
jgi:3-deoxy-D-manno-octulosonic-acid transferase